ncbi:hypothetical protein [Salinibius halmophilus]|uniref:hypothetical protein n=1 Tax=Salinibius halmophilus TaxID=1853216 RepID=UPI000E6600FD|nr:hypothetical protein [Salinibius halmophilus]
MRCLFTILATLTLAGCATPMPWPQSPLYAASTAEDFSQLSKSEAKAAAVGHYGHYDVVAYEDDSMRTFVISYGFTTIYLDGDTLMQRDRFCSASHKINYNSVESYFSDAATRAIVPPDHELTVSKRDNTWWLSRAETPTLLGVAADPNKPLVQDPSQYQFIDADNDGNPGVTVELLVGGFYKGELYIARRERFANEIALTNRYRLEGYVRDQSEQLVIGASSRLFDRPANPAQVLDWGLNPLLLVRIPPNLTDCDALMAQRDLLFPPEPEFD